jgi:hypothetical protein
MEKGIEDTVGEADQIFQFKQQMMKELRAQRVYINLVSLPPAVVSSSHIGDDEEGQTLLLALRLETWLMPPPLSNS